ncbi:MAG: DNA repair protein [Planctomycetota bacterium]|nr:DNA repair protein [Planctomycetota bacterium]
MSETSIDLAPITNDALSLRRRLDRLAFARQEAIRQVAANTVELERLKGYLRTADRVSTALEKLNQDLFSTLLGTVQEKITIALQEILEQPISFHAEAGFSRNSASVEFWIERNGKQEDLLNGQGGSVANIVSVCLRIFALTTLDEATHRRFLVLDEQDCWLRADLVPKLVKIIHDASRALGFQVLMISHHDRNLFEQYADKIIELQWQNGQVVAVDTTAGPSVHD